MTTNHSKQPQFWQQLVDAAPPTAQPKISELFKDEINRAESFTFRGAQLNLDLSRQRISQSTLLNLTKIGHDLQIPDKIENLFKGEKVNHTEDRPAFHSALRKAPDELPQEILLCLNRIKLITQKLHSKLWLGYNHTPISNIVNIGIGGSDLGPKMAVSALREFHAPSIKTHFVSNADYADIESNLEDLNPETTLFVVASKSWTTQETQLNALRAKNWLMESGCPYDKLQNHFIAITTKVKDAKSFGINEDNILPMWDWVGGRFSLWSAVGLTIALATSFEHFQALLNGARAMDQHFQKTKLSENLPFLLAATEIWNTNILQHKNQAIVPYSHDLRFLTDHLQQLLMESNGKSVNKENTDLNYDTSPVIWGSAGTVGQHSYHQLLHQGTQTVPVDFILPLTPTSGSQEEHNHLIANCLAQAEVLMDGLSAEEIETQLITDGETNERAQALSKHKAMPGNRPSTLITFDALTPETLGSLIALYEHKVYCSSIFWDINAFDQWGVELGKTVAKELTEQLSSKHVKATNPATRASLERALSALKSENMQ